MKKLLLASLTIITISSFGQYTVGIKINAGLSKISNSLDPSNADFRVQVAPTGNIGIFYNLQLSQKLYLGSELLFFQMESKEKLEMDLFDGVDTVGHAWDLNRRHISYLSIPIYIGIRFNKFSVDAGFQYGHALTSSGKSKGETTINGETTSYEKKYGNLNILKSDYGPRLGIIYYLNPSVSLEGNFYYGLPNILNNSGFLAPWTWKNRQASIGIRWNIIKSRRFGK